MVWNNWGGVFKRSLSIKPFGDIMHSTAEMSLSPHSKWKNRNPTSLIKALFD